MNRPEPGKDRPALECLPVSPAQRIMANRESEGGVRSSWERDRGEAEFARNEAQAEKEQALLAASELVQVDGLPAPLSGNDLNTALRLAYSEGQPHLLGVLRRLPGTTASKDSR